MWLEIKAVITCIGCFIFAVIIGLSGNLVFMILGIMGISTMIFGDLLFGWKVVSTDAYLKIDPVGPGEKVIELHLIGGLERLVKGFKGPKGKWNFMFNKYKCSVLDDGKYPVRFPNGNPVIVAHESYDQNLNFYKGEYLRESFDTHKVSDSKQLFEVLRESEGNREKT